MLEHGIELQFVAGTGFVGGERPGRGVESEVIVFFGRALAGRRGAVQGKDELAFFSSVVQKGRRLHVGRGLLRGFGGGGDANSRRAIGQRDDLVISDDLLNLLQAIFVEGQDGVADDLLFLELADYVAIVGRGQVALLRDFGGDDFHFALDLGEFFVGHLGDLCGRDVDAVVFEGESVLLGRQAEIGARLGQHGGLEPRVVFSELRFQRGVGLFPAGEFVFFEEHGDAFEIICIAPISHQGLNLDEELLHSERAHDREQAQERGERPGGVA